LHNVPPEGIRITDLGERLGMTKQASGQFVSALMTPDISRHALIPTTGGSASSYALPSATGR
jgi:hypothetical protein